MTDKDKHTPTPTPWMVNQFDIDSPITMCSARDGEWVCRVSSEGSWARQTPARERKNALLIVAAVNSYGKHCPSSCLSQAEDDALGRAIGLLKEVRENRLFYNQSMDINDYLNDDIDSFLSRLG
jgi:hypothetical protein